MITNKKGVTLLEGLIALALLAMVAVGTFSVLLSSSRKSSGPDKAEEMLLAIERAHHGLQVFNPAMVNTYIPLGYFRERDSSSFTGNQSTVSKSFFGKIVAGNSDEINPITRGEITVKELLPLTCKWVSSNSSPSTFAIDNYKPMAFNPLNNDGLSGMVSSYGSANLMLSYEKAKLAVKKFTILCLDEKDGI